MVATQPTEIECAHCNILQHTATTCSAQHTATHCNILQHTYSWLSSNSQESSTWENPGIRQKLVVGCGLRPLESSR